MGQRPEAKTQYSDFRLRVGDLNLCKRAEFFQLVFACAIVNSTTATSGVRYEYCTSLRSEDTSTDGVKVTFICSRGRATFLATSDLTGKKLATEMGLLTGPRPPVPVGGEIRLELQ